nr:hypothetical protein [Tanacetum cinerariifolium]
RLQFCDYHNMVAILEKSEHNVDFHPMVDFIETSPLRYALTVKPTVYVSHIRQFWSTARIETMEEGTKILAIVDGIHRTVTESYLRRNLKLSDEEGISESSGTPTEPHHTPSPEAQPPSYTTHSSSSFPPVTTTIPTITPSETTPIKQYTRRARIARSSTLPTVANEPESPLRDISQRDACPTDFGFIADQDRETIAMSSALPNDLATRVPSPAADEELLAKFQAQEVEINRLKERVKLLEYREGGVIERFGDDSQIKGRSLDEGDAAAERTSDDIKEMATVLTSMDTTTVLASRAVEVPTGSGSIPIAGPPSAEVPIGSDVVPTASPVFATATVIDAQVTRELEEQLEREDQKRSAQIARDAEIARIHDEEELQIMIDGLDKNNETIAKYVQEYHQFASELPIERRIELISDLVKGMTFKEVEAKFNSVWKQMEDFIPMGSREEAERIKIREDLNQLWRLVKETLSNKTPTSDKEMELWDKENFMLVEKDYPLRKGLALVMISYKLQVKNYSQMANDLILKIYKIANSPRQQCIEFPLAEEVPTASEEGCHCQKKRDATARKIALLSKSRRNYQSKSNNNFTKLVPHVTSCILGITITVKSYTRTPCPIKRVF